MKKKVRSQEARSNGGLREIVDTIRAQSPDAADVPNEDIVSPMVLEDERMLIGTEDGFAKVLAARAADAVGRLARLRARQGDGGSTVSSVRARDVALRAVEALLAPTDAEREGDVERMHAGLLGAKAGNVHLFLSLRQIARAARTAWATGHHDPALANLRTAMAKVLGADARATPSDADLRELLAAYVDDRHRDNSVVARLLVWSRWSGIDARVAQDEQIRRLAKYLSDDVFTND